MPIDINALADQIALEIADYREGEIARPDRNHVLRWVNQFDPIARGLILQETAHFLGRRYASKANVHEFINALVQHNDLTGVDQRAFWSGVGFLRLQQRSQSQRDMLAILSGILEQRFGFRADRQISENRNYVYIDDGIFSGRQIRSEIIRWVRDNDIRDCKVHIIVIGMHKNGYWYTNKKINEDVSGRNVNVRWWRALEIEDWKKPDTVNTVSVLWPRQVPDNQYVQQWQQLCPEDARHFNPRPASTANNPNFASEAGREMLEEHFLIKGAFIRSICRNPADAMRPLGYHSLHGAGFGTLFATYRNCPNNCPLVLWWGNPTGDRPLNQWYPLLPRRTRAYNWGADFEDF